MIGPLRDALERALLKELFGDAFRLDRPVETLGGVVRQLIDTKDPERFRELQGNAKTIIHMFEILAEQWRDM